MLCKSPVGRPRAYIRGRHLSTQRCGFQVAQRAEPFSTWGIFLRRFNRLEPFISVPLGTEVLRVYVPVCLCKYLRNVSGTRCIHSLVVGTQIWCRHVDTKAVIRRITAAVRRRYPQASSFTSTFTPGRFPIMVFSVPQAAEGTETETPTETPTATVTATQAGLKAKTSRRLLAASTV